MRLRCRKYPGIARAIIKEAVQKSAEQVRPVHWQERDYSVVVRCKPAEHGERIRLPASL
jgi:hypothetical protein